MLGKVHLYRSEYEEARSVLNEAIRLGMESNTMPQVHEAMVELADCLLQLGDLQESLRLATSLIETESALASLRQKAGQMLEEIKKAG